ncbi:magnesium transporter CorA family protein [Gordonia sinesedis]
MPGHTARWQRQRGLPVGTADDVIAWHDVAMNAADAKHEESVRGQVWVKGDKVDGFSLDTLSERLKEPDTLVWIDLDCPSHDTLTKLAERFDFNSYAIEDTLGTAERVKTVAYHNFTFMTVYAVTLVEGADSAGQPSDRIGDSRSDSASQARTFLLHRISIFVTENALITVRLTPGFDMAEVMRRWDESGDQQYGIGALVHGLLDVVVDGHFAAVQTLDDSLEDLEGLLFSERTVGSQLQRETFTLRKDLVVLRRVVLPMREVIGGIQRHRIENHAPSELDPNFSDLYDHTLRAAEWTESLRDMVTTVFETNLSLSDERLNRVMKTLTAWAGIIAVPTAITGFFGQNVPFPGFSQPIGFIASATLIVLMVVVLFVTFRRHGWL